MTLDLDSIAEANAERILQACLTKTGVPEHLHDGFIGYLVHRIQPGHFLTACLENNLSEAMGRADDKSRAGLFNIVLFLYNDVSMNAWGSPEKVKVWLMPETEKEA